MEYSLDKPIDNEKQDLLHRNEFAKHFAKDIVMLSDRNNFTIALNGSWGSGKTSLINLIKNEIIRLRDYEGLESYPVIVNFEPWNCLDENGIINQFFNTILNQFSSHKIIQILKNKKVQKTIELLQKLPKVGNILKTLHNLFGKYLKEFLSDNKNLLDTKEKINKKLQGLPYNFIVFIDDIDRLNNKEIKLLFQLIKAVCNFPNITYVLAYDKEIVANALSNEQTPNGFKYLEKIIQLSIDVPDNNEEDFQSYLFKKINDIIKDIPEKEFDGKRWGYIFRNGYYSYFNNLRDINRYINCINFKYPSYKEVLDIVDYLALEAISLFDPQLLNVIKQNKSLLCNSNLITNNEENLKSIENFYNQCKMVTNNYEMLKYIFPYLNQNDWTYSEILHNTQYKSRGRICIESNFEYYFTGQLSKSSISKQFVQSILNEKSENIINEKLKSMNNQSFGLFLQYLYGFMKDKNENVINLMPKVIESSKNYKDLTNFKVFKNSIYIYGILELWFKEQNKVTSFAWIKNIFKTSNNYDMLIQLIYNMASETNFYYKNQKGFNENYFNESEIYDLHKILVKKIKNHLNNDKIIYDEKLIHYIRFLNFKNDNILKTWLKNNKANLYKILGVSVEKGYGESFNRFITYRFPFDIYEKILNIQKEQKDALTYLKTNTINDNSFLGLILLTMPKKEDNEYYESNEINQYCKDNNINFTCLDEFVDE